MRCLGLGHAACVLPASMQFQVGMGLVRSDVVYFLDGFQLCV